MKERPIIFSAPMVRAILAGTKTQTRRAISNPHRNDGGFVLQDHGNGWWPYRSHDGESGCYLDRQKDGDYYSEAPLRCPYGQPGDRLWVRETWRGVVNIAPPGAYEYAVARYVPDREHCRRIEYAATQKPDREPWKPSIHMPRWASRITLEITGVRVERLQDISEADAIAEGVRPIDFGDRNSPQPSTAKFTYWNLWRAINGPGSWAENPWGWVVEFKRLEENA